MATTQGVQNRRRSREIALQVLYSLAQGNASYDQTFEMYAHEPPLVLAYALKLIQGVQAHQDAILAEVGAHSAELGH